MIAYIAIAGIFAFAVLKAYQADAAVSYDFSSGEIPMNTGNDINSIINSNSGPFDPGDIAAIIQIESGFNPTAYRYEAHLNEASYGLMQMLESTARDMGLSGPPEQLYDPQTSIRLGVKYLVWIRDYLARKLGRQPTMQEILSGYNAGVGNVLKGYIPTQYIAKWQNARANYA